jgi:sulfonate transport system permease protein
MSFKSKTEGSRFDRYINISLIFFTPALILAAWQIASINGKINASVLPSPFTIGETIVSMSKSGELFQHLGISLVRVLKGYVFGCLFGMIAGTLVGLVRKFESSMTLVFGVIRPIPIIAWVPILILWMGIGEVSKVMVIAFGTFFPVMLNTVYGIQSTDKKYLEIAYSLEKSPTKILVKVILPSALPAIFTGARIGLGIAWMSVVGAELIAASSGIGYLISYAGQLSQPDVMLAGVFSIGIIGLLIDILLKAIERLVLKWNVNMNMQK